MLGTYNMRPKTLIFSLIAAVLAWSLLSVGLPRSALADSRDEVAMGQVGQSIDDLWSFVDDSGNMKDDEFYPEFAQRAMLADETINASYQQLVTTREKGKAREAILAIRNDIGAIEVQLNAWRDAALAQDATSFEQVNNQLSDTVDQYNHDIDVYNAAKDGGKSAYAIAGYAVGPAAAFALLCLLSAWALIANEKTDDVANELQRRLRWHGVFSAATVLLGVGVPAVWFFFTDFLVPKWTWCLMLPGIFALLLTAFRYLRVRFLSRRA